MTPLIESGALARPGGPAFFLKMEALQASGSFKLRGIEHACARYAAQGARRFVSSSGGNAGIAAAHAGRRLGLPVTVVVPETTSARARELIAREGAEIVVHGASFQEANALALSMLGPQDAFIHPFDDPLLWEGHAGMIDEVAAAGLVPDAVLLSVGGGGLLCGVVEGLRRQGWNDVPVFAAETAGADSYARSLQAGERIELPAITSIATSLGARRVSEQAFALTAQHPIVPQVVSDRAAVDACLRFMDDHRVVVEPACGAALALAYAARDAADEAAADLASESHPLAGYARVLVIVCGGVTATVEQLQRWGRELPAA
jgi:L-serine/L-threonine ammonia-lyase